VKEFRLLLIPDVPNWAWHTRCKAIEEFNQFCNVHIDVICQGDVTQEMLGKYRAVLVMSWPDAPNWTHPNLWTFVANEGTVYPFPHIASDPKYKRTASRLKNIRTAQEKLPRYAGVININSRIQETLCRLHPNVRYMRTGVHVNFWDQCYPPQTTLPITIGWSGKSFDDPNKWTPKGYQEVLVPVRQECLRLFGKDVFWEVNRAAWGKNMLTPESQREFYSGSDVFLVTSCSEGTPSVLMEAMSCGRMAITTDVGIAREIERELIADGCPEDQLPIRIVDRWGTRDEADATVQQIIEQIGMVLNEHDQIAVRGEMARMAMCQHFDWLNIADEWVDLILKG